MKFFLSLLTLGVVSGATKKSTERNTQYKLPENIKVNSGLGRKLISNARSLDQNNEIDFGWVENYSIKFQGCHHISQWNEDVNDEDDVRIATKRLVRFRLCPSDICSLQSDAGCNSDYGDYVIDMSIFLQYYVESIEQYKEAKCEYLQNTCECGDDDGYCLYDCYVKNGMEETCADYNPYNADAAEEKEEFEIANYVECGAAQFGNRRRLEEEEEEEEEAAADYYLGPYCAEQGGAIFLGMFSDDTCTTFADNYGGHQSYYQMSGTELPFANSNIVSTECLSCMEPEVEYNYDGNDNQDADNVNQMCENVYEQAGKCEERLETYGGNSGACSYIKGIKVIRKNGIIVDTTSTANRIASVFTAAFVVGFLLLSLYVSYLKNKLHRASINLEN